MFRLCIHSTILVLTVAFLTTVDAHAADEDSKLQQPDPNSQSTDPESTDPHESLQLDVNPLERAIEGMREAQQRIAKQDTGQKTRDIQKRVIDDLAKLIQLAEQMPARRSPSSRQPQPEQKHQDQPKKQSPQPQPQDKPGQQDNEDDAADSQQRTRESRKRDAQFLERRLIKDVWGHLPEKIRQQLRNIHGGKTLDKYSELVSRYFEALADESRDERRD